MEITAVRPNMQLTIRFHLERARLSIMDEIIDLVEVQLDARELQELRTRRG